MALVSRDELDTIPQDLQKAIKDASAMWEDVYNVISYAVRALFYGPPATGKSTVSSKHDIGLRPLERISITPETCWPEVRGHYGMNAGGMVWLDGPGARAWRNGSRLVIDEIDQAGGDTIPGLHMLCDDNAVAALTLPTGETIRPKESFQVFATSNALPTALPEALADRFVIKREVSRPSPRMLFSLSPCLRVAAAYSLYSASADRIAMSTRGWVELDRLMRHHGLNVRDALAVVIGPKKAKDAALAIEVAATKQQQAEMARTATINP